MLLHFPFLLFVKINHFCDFCRRKNASVQNIYDFLGNLNDFHTSIRKHSFIEEPLKDSQNIKAIRLAIYFSFGEIFEKGVDQ